MTIIYDQKSSIYDKKSSTLSLKDIRASNCMSEADLEELERKMMEVKLQAEVDEWYRKRGKKEFKQEPRRRNFPSTG